MVCFTCGSCNQTLKKNKVSLHFQGKCRNAEFVSCVDCSTDFYGDEYMGHTSCVSEAEKYGGKNFTVSSNANKGQKKQDLWIEKVQQVIDSTQSGEPIVIEMLEYIKTAPNIPQKKAKFINFLQSTFPRYRHQERLITQIWKMLEEAKGQMKSSQDAVQAAKTEKVSDVDENGTAVGKRSAVEEVKKKKKKRGAQDEEEIREEEVEAIRENKRRKREAKLNPVQDNVDRLNDTLEESEKTAKDFHWETLITEILEKGEITLKKLRKKVVAEFVACGKYMKKEEKVWRKLDKKLHSMTTVQVANDRVSLVEC